MWPILVLADAADLQLLDQPTTSIQPRVDTQLLRLNQGRTGYYLTLYDSAHTAALADDVRGGNMPAIDRLGLLSDSLALAKAGLQSSRDALKLLEAYRHETSQPVWGAITDHLGALKMFAEQDEAVLADLRRFIKKLAQEQFDRLGWEPKKGESYFDELLRPTIIAHMAYSEDPAVVQHMQAALANAAKPADILATTSSAEERVNLTAGIASVRDPQLIQRAIGMLTTDAVKLQDLFYWFVYLLRNRYARDMTWQWMQDNWQWIEDHFGRDMHFTDFPRYTSSAFSTQAQLDSYKQFFEPKMNHNGLQRFIKQGIEDIESKVLWRQRDFEAVAEYLRTQG